MSRNLVLLLALLFACVLPALAAIEQPLADPAQETRARQVFASLRCVVCQGQSIADSNSAVAGDLRAAVRQMIKDGKSDDEIINTLVSSYGEVVLQLPRFSVRTWMLWLGPMLVGLIGIAVVLAYFGASRIQKR